MKNFNLISLFALSLVLSVSCSKDTESTPAAATPTQQEKPSDDQLDPQASSANDSVSGTHILLPAATPTPMLINSLGKPPAPVLAPSNIIPNGNGQFSNVIIDLGPNGLQVIRRNTQNSAISGPTDVNEDETQTDLSQTVPDLDQFFNPKPGYQISSPENKALYLKLLELSQNQEREAILINDDINILAQLATLKNYAYSLSISPFLLTNEAKFILAELKKIETSLGKPLEHLRKIEEATAELKEIGFELELFENEYRWREREVTDEFGNLVTWSVLLSKREAYYQLMTSVDFLIVVSKLKPFSAAVGNYGREFKEEMDERTLSRWRSIHPLLKETDQSIREAINN